MSFVLDLQALEHAATEQALGPISTESVFACTSSHSWVFC